MKRIKVKKTTRVVTPIEYMDLAVPLRRRCVIKPDPEVQVMFRMHDKRIFVEFLCSSKDPDCLVTFLRLPFHKGLNNLFISHKVGNVNLKDMINAPSEPYDKSYFLIDNYEVLFIVDEINIV